MKIIKSVKSVRGVRFNLTAQCATELGRFDNRPQWAAYVCKRQDLYVALLLQRRAKGTQVVMVPYWYRDSVTRKLGSREFGALAINKKNETISIGCQTFRGEDAKALIRWAKGYKR